MNVMKCICNFCKCFVSVADSWFQQFNGKTLNTADTHDSKKKKRKKKKYLVKLKINNIK